MKKFLLLAGLTLVLIAAVALWVVFVADYSEGYRVGQVIKLSHKGLLLKTWEGTLDQGFLQPQSNPGSAGVATRLWDFSVDRGDADTRKDIDTAIAQGGRVKLYYREKLFLVRLRGDTKYFVYKVERVGS